MPLRENVFFFSKSAALHNRQTFISEWAAALFIYIFYLQFYIMGTFENLILKKKKEHYVSS